MKSLTTFNIGEFYFGVEVQQVQEVIKYQELTPITIAPEVFAGLMNLRGEIVTVIDLARRLNIKREKAIQPESQMNVVIRDDESVVSLLVDSIGDIQEVREEDFERAPETLKGVAKDLIVGAYKLTDRLLLVLDIKSVLEISIENK